MLSAKNSNKHGMKKEKWKTREKIGEYRAILKLHGRDKRLQATNGTRLKKKYSKKCRTLETDVSEYRKIVNDVMFGDKRLLRAGLQSEKEFQILLADAVPAEAHRAIFQDYNLKRKQLDKLLHLKQKVTEDFCRVKHEHSDLLERLDNPSETKQEIELQDRQQLLVSRYQVALAKRHAAKSISDAYRDILAILKKDSMYYDGVVKALGGEQREQCRLMYRTTIMGQLASENLDDYRLIYKRMAHDVWLNMKERERSLEDTRRKVDDLWSYAKSLVRIESETDLKKKKKKGATNVDENLEKQLKQLESIFLKIKDALKIRTYDELRSRLEDQVRKWESLSHLYQRNLKERDYVLNKKNHAEMMLQTLNHSMVSTTTRYVVDKNEMREKIKAERQRLAECNEKIVSRGESLMNIRSALQNIAAMLICIEPGKMAVKKMNVKRTTEEPAEEEEELQTDPGDNKVCSDLIETDALGVLMQVTRKAAALFSLTNVEFAKARAEKAKDIYENYIANYQSQLKFGDEEEQEAGMYFEHVIADQGVPTRSEIKKKSKNVVELNTKID